MDWEQLGQQVADAGADILGEAIPIPGAGMAIDAVANALGADKDPDSISKAIEQDPQAASKLRQVQLNNETELKRIAAQRKTDHERELTKRQENVSETMQTGYKQGVLWRRAVGWAFVFCACLVVIRVTILPVILSATGHADILKDASINAQIIKWVFSCFLAVLGVSSWHEGLMGRSMSGEQGGKIERIIGSLKGK